MLFSMRRFDDTRTRLIFSVTALMVALAALFVFLYVAQLKNLEQQRRNEIRRIVQVASRSIAPILARYNQGMLPKEEALRQVTDLIRRMTYDDVFGPNYVFMSDYDGTMLVQPYERAKEGTNQAELRDSRGVFIIRALVERAKAGGGYVSYEYPPPNSEEPQRKISYVVGIPELSCYIGTGMYVTDLEKDLRLFMGKVLLLSLVLLGGGLTLAARLLKPLFSSYAALTAAIDELRNHPEKVPDLPVAQYRPGSEAERLLAGFLSLHEDMRSATRRLREREEQLQIFFEEAVDGIVRADEHLGVLEANAQILAWTGFSLEEMLGRPVEKLFPPEELRRKPLQMEELKQGVTVANERKLLRRDGTSFWVEVRTKRLSDGTMQSIVRDISDRRNAEERLQQHRALMEALVRNLPVEFWVHDMEGRIILQNDLSLAKRGNLFGKRDGEANCDRGSGELWEEKLRQARAGTVVDFEVQAKDPGSGTIRHYRNILAPIRQEGNVTSVMGFLFDITEERLRDEQIHRMAYYDALTDLPNRRLLLERLDEVLRRARSGETRGALIFLDVDDFRIVNDSLGHASGDRVLQDAARRFLAVSTEKDLVTRMGGDEFLVLREGEDSREEIESYARRLLGTFADPFADEGTSHFYSLTAGVVLFPDDGTDPGELLKKADMALHKAKAECRGDLVFYEESLSQDLLRRIDLERRLRSAVSQGLLSLHYQPLFSAVSRRVVGFEALLRWNDPELGWISPGEFVPVAESSGLIFPLGEFALRRACRFARELLDGGEVHHMAVNLSTRQIQQEGFALEVLRILKETGLPPEALEVEITETALLTSYETSLENLRVLKSHGVRIALDDFGTGYSSLTYLRTLPLDTLKIDRSFIQNLHEQKENELIVWAIIQLARELGLQIVAEGVETEEQVRFTTTSCDVIQGFWFSRPLPEEDIRPFLNSLRKD